MFIDTERMIPITRLQKEFTKRMREVAAEDKPLYVMKNNRMEAVILSAKEYDFLANLAEILEHFEIAEMVAERTGAYKKEENVAWEVLRRETEDS